MSNNHLLEKNLNEKIVANIFSSLVDGEKWLDLVVWETMEDAQNAVKEFYNSDLALEYASFMVENEGDLLHFSVQKSY